MKQTKMTSSFLRIWFCVLMTSPCMVCILCGPYSHHILICFIQSTKHKWQHCQAKSRNTDHCLVTGHYIQDCFIFLHFFKEKLAKGTLAPPIGLPYSHPNSLVQVIREVFVFSLTPDINYNRLINRWLSRDLYACTRASEIHLYFCMMWQYDMIVSDI